MRTQDIEKCGAGFVVHSNKSGAVDITYLFSIGREPELYR